jgi:hypothetical protein
LVLAGGEGRSGQSLLNIEDASPRFVSESEGATPDEVDAAKTILADRVAFVRTGRNPFSIDAQVRMGITQPA